jgi:signal transduction histidine kinase
LLTNSTLPNLFDTHPPFQIDGNFGGAAGIGEMLMQSHEDCISLLPAVSGMLPEGSFRGLRARGGIEISADWKDGRITHMEITPDFPREVTIELENGESQWLSGIKNQVTKLASLTEKLVLLSKMEEGAKLEMVDFALSEAFFDTCEQYESIAVSKGVSFKMDIEEGVRIVGNEGEIRRCITLMLDNAFRYVNERGSVGVKVASVSGKAEIRCTNTTSGGIEKGSLDKWFDRFYRTDVSRNSDTGGSGIGLSVVKAIILAHGGVVRAHSDGENVEFTITI